MCLKYLFYVKQSLFIKFIYIYNIFSKENDRSDTRKCHVVFVLTELLIQLGK